VNGDGNADSPHYLGVSQVLKSYYFSIMVDFWGDVPYSEAFKGNATPQIKTPLYDDDAAIYADCIKLLNDAIANFALPSAVTVKGDVFYTGNITRWRKATQVIL
jgi:Starch-binding associating with outer membrane